MVNKRFGSLFRGIFEKSPETADRLKKMANESKCDQRHLNQKSDRKEKADTKTNISSKKRPKRKQSVDRMKGVTIEKRSIVARTKKKKNSNKAKQSIGQRKSRGKNSKITNTISGNSQSTTNQSNRSDQFFNGVPENAHQFRLTDGSSKLDVVIGIDFGTSSTKVVVHVPNFPGNPAYAVPFGEFAHDTLQYLLPTRLNVNKSGECSFLAEPDSSVLTDIKIGLIRAPHNKVVPASGPNCDVPATTVTTAYLALTMRYLRCWFIAHKRDIFRDFSLNWSCNLGLPAAIDDDRSLRETFNLAGKAAWLLSRRLGPITISGAQKAIGDVKNSRFNAEDMPWDFELIPEVIAEVTGYARSQFRNEGLHLLVDIGASTLDICSFILHQKEGDDDFPILTADVGLLGAKRLHLARIDGAKLAVASHVSREFDQDDPAGLIPDDIEVYVADGTEIHEKTVEAEGIFKDECKMLLNRTLMDLRKRRDPHSSRWMELLPVFVCGGASAMLAYSDVVSSVDPWLQRFISSSQGARFIKLPKPDSLEAEIGDDLYHRLAVAWGLSHESHNIGTYSRPSEIDDVPPPQIRKIEEVFISKDMV